jgi:hypothetical protein
MNGTNTHAQKSRRRNLLGVLITLGGSFLAACAAGLSASAATTVTAPPRLEIDLNAFDASKKLIALPDGESLAYIERDEEQLP